MKYLLLIHQGDAPTPRSPEEWERLSEDELVFTCCHPALALDAQVALTLRAWAG